MLRYYSQFLFHHFHNKALLRSKMHQVISLAKSVAPTDMNVLIMGENGTGKRALAQAIHADSRRKYGRFLVVNCMNISRDSIEVELFGCDHCASDCPSTQKIGKFEQARGGTIFLHEVGEIDLLLQAKLLRVLRDREIQRVDGVTRIPIDVRIITSTSKDLSISIKEGRFRESLYYHLSAFPIVIPSLRECREDIPLLARHFLNYAVEESNKSISDISAPAMESLVNYDWPGNFQELEDVIKEAVARETSNILRTSSLPQKLLSEHKSLLRDAPGGKVLTDVLPLREIERQAIVHALKVTGNNIQQAAKALGINRATIYRKLKKHNLLEEK